MPNLRSCLVALVLVPVCATADIAGDTGHWGLDLWGREGELAAHQSLLDRVAKTGGTPDGFVSDGCSGGLSAVWRQVATRWPGFADLHHERPPFEECCIRHDRAYHDMQGAQSAPESYRARLSADRQLRACVQQVGQTRKEDLAEGYGLPGGYVEEAYGQLARAIYYAVRFGGGPCSGQDWRWGYGYPNC